MEAVTSDSHVVQTNDLQTQAASQELYPETRAQIEQIEEWRRAQDALYRIFTNPDPQELNEFVLGLVASGANGTKVGLLRELYYCHMDDNCRQTLDYIESDIIESQLKLNTASHRTICHCLLLVATTLECQFLSYIVLHTHNREALRYYLNNSLQNELAKFLQGGFEREKRERGGQHSQVALADVPFEISMFVANSRHLYAIYCMPRKAMAM